MNPNEEFKRYIGLCGSYLEEIKEKGIEEWLEKQWR